MPKKLFVGGLSWDTDDDSLRKAFESYGEINEAKVITDRDSRRSRGFGFATFVRDEDAKTAVSKMHGASLDGRNIRVNEAQEKSPRGGADPAVVLGAVVAVLNHYPLFHKEMAYRGTLTDAEPLAKPRHHR